MLRFVPEPVPPEVVARKNATMQFLLLVATVVLSLAMAVGASSVLLLLLVRVVSKVR
jgi:hypothetical protein